MKKPDDNTINVQKLVRTFIIIANSHQEHQETHRNSPEANQNNSQKKEPCENIKVLPANSKKIIRRPC
jgi:hypothetical protein